MSENHLGRESSPYLLQHAKNPVNWYGWNSESLEKSKSENKPIFLSIGYSSCHWCHVMAHESFENEDIAQILNDNFINIKVDREERPDIDDIYQKACQMVTGQGGWPLSVFLTPEKKPFYVGTYFPPLDSYGRPGFGSITRQLAQAWKENHSDVVKKAENFVDQMRKPIVSENIPVEKSILDEAAITWSAVRIKWWKICANIERFFFRCQKDAQRPATLPCNHLTCFLIYVINVWSLFSVDFYVDEIII